MEYDIANKCTVSSWCTLGPMCIPYKKPAIKRHGKTTCIAA